MTAAVAIVAVALLGIALALVLLRRARPQRPASSSPVSWTQAAGDDFAALSDSERCDLVFALAAVDDESSRALLERALDDPSEAVCLAAARALVKLGRNDALGRYITAHPGERTRRIVRTLELFT